MVFFYKTCCLFFLSSFIIKLVKKMVKKIVIIASSILMFLTISILIAAYFLFLHHYKGTNVINPWTKDDEFKIEDIATIKKEKNQDFVILNLADIQICDLEDLFKLNKIKKEIDELVEKTKPNLITLTGDQTWSNENLISLKAIISWLDSYKIPYAPVFGNHDTGNGDDNAVLSRNKCMDLYENGRYSLFKRGPSNLGITGNYIINIMEDDKIYKTLYMLDAGVLDTITYQQKEWVLWNANKIKESNDGTFSEGMVFMHKPIPEYYDAYRAYLKGEIEAIGDIYVTYSLNGTRQNGFFDLCKEINVKDIIVGHQHGNLFTLPYEGVRLTFSLKTTELGGYYEDDKIYLVGATYLLLNKDVEYKNYFVDKKKYGFKKES